MNKLPDSQLVLNTDGSIYHLKLHPGQLAKNIIVVGDPNRVPVVSKHFDALEHQVSNREIITHTGRVGNIPISVMSTGMGTDNIDIVINEIDALFNIDLETREIKEDTTSLNIVRLGTSGALQADIPVEDSFVASNYGLGLDGLIQFYQVNKDIKEEEMTKAFMDHVNWNPDFPKPYIVEGSSLLLDTLGKDLYKGITATAPGFYAPQGRRLRIPLRAPEMNQLIETFNFKGNRISNFEMETSALYGLGKQMGHNMLTICAIIANRVTEKFNPNYKQSVEKLIKLTIERFESNF
ncbi:MAG: nucleoside phosphorylase [Hyphomicrobiales bacterium]